MLTLKLFLPPILQIQILAKRLPQHLQRATKRQIRRQPIELLQIMLREPRLRRLIRKRRPPDLQPLSRPNTRGDLLRRAMFLPLQSNNRRDSHHVHCISSKMRQHAHRKGESRSRIGDRSGVVRNESGETAAVC